MSGDSQPCRAYIMKTPFTKTRIAEETAQRLATLVKSLKGWNLVSGLYSLEHRTPEEDLVHALAVEAREIVLISIRLTCRLGELLLQEADNKPTRLIQQLNELDEREKRLAVLCRKALREVGDTPPPKPTPHGKGVAA